MSAVELFLIAFGVGVAIFGSIWFWRSRLAKEADAKGAAEVAALRAKRRAELVERFGEENAERILAHQVWMGATYAMLWESVGYPDGITEKTTARREREIYKYCETAKGRFAFKVTVDDGVVTGWEGDRGAAATEAAMAQVRREYREPAKMFWNLRRVLWSAAGFALLVVFGRIFTQPPFYLPTSHAGDHPAPPAASPSSASTALPAPTAKASATAAKRATALPRVKDAGAAAAASASAAALEIKTE